MISVFTVAFNEELQIKFFIDFYRSRFPNCSITIYDNLSTDKTVEIALANNCQVISYDTNNKISDRKYLEIKNNCWRISATDWVLVCDVDELLDINQEQLKYEDSIGTSIISAEGYNMINMENNFDLSSITYGARHESSDKKYLFKSSLIDEINYEPGCHVSNPVGNVILSKTKYKAYHYNFINEEESIKKYKLYSARLSDENKKMGWGNHYSRSEEEIRSEFADIRSKAIKLL